MMAETPDLDLPGGRRPLSDLETRFVAHLLQAASDENERLITSLDRVKVREMDDGGQGSLHFEQPHPRRGSRQLSEFRFTDSDGVPVSATLNLDQLGDLYELDIFKGNFGNLIALPDIYE